MGDIVMLDIFALEILEMAYPFLAKAIVWLVILTGMHVFLEKEQYEYTEDECQYNWSLAWIGALILFAFP